MVASIGQPTHSFLSERRHTKSLVGRRSLAVTVCQSTMPKGKGKGGAPPARAAPSAEARARQIEIAARQKAARAPARPPRQTATELDTIRARLKPQTTIVRAKAAGEDRLEHESEESSFSVNCDSCDIKPVSRLHVHYLSSCCIACKPAATVFQGTGLCRTAVAT